MKRKLVIKEIAWVLFVIISGLYVAGMLSSCTRYYTPHQAASTGGKTCSKWNSIR